MCIKTIALFLDSNFEQIRGVPYIFRTSLKTSDNGEKSMGPEENLFSEEEVEKTGWLRDHLQKDVCRCGKMQKESMLTSVQWKKALNFCTQFRNDMLDNRYLENVQLCGFVFDNIYILPVL